MYFRHKIDSFIRQLSCSNKSKEESENVNHHDIIDIKEQSTLDEATTPAEARKQLTERQPFNVIISNLNTAAPEFETNPLSHDGDYDTPEISFLKCDECQVEYNSTDRPGEHIDTCHKIITCLCDLCEQIFESQELLLKHVNDTHLYQATCNYCNFKGKSEDDVTTHMKMHLNYPCEQCNFSGQEAMELINHSMRAHRLDLFTCKFCQLYTANSSILQDHVANEHPVLKKVSNPEQESSSERQEVVPVSNELLVKLLHSMVNEIRDDFENKLEDSVVKMKDTMDVKIKEVQTLIINHELKTSVAIEHVKNDVKE